MIAICSRFGFSTATVDMDYTLQELAWIGVGVFMMGMSKGGFPIGTVALPLLILMWPGRAAEPARTAVAFMLPILCAMDVIAVAFYRRHILWNRIRLLLPGTIAGIAVGSILFVAKDATLLAVSDRSLKMAVGVVGLVFVAHRFFMKWILRKLQDATVPGLKVSTAFGFAAGLTSTLAHAAAPLLQMYLLPQKLEKMCFAGTNAAYFLVTNFIKLLPFAVLGRIEQTNLVLGVYMLPSLVVGVVAGYLLMRITKPAHYTALIYVLLAIASVMLIYKAV